MTLMVGGELVLIFFVFFFGFFLGVFWVVALPSVQGTVECGGCRA
jgi:hypothetical protein